MQKADPVRGSVEGGQVDENYPKTAKESHHFVLFTIPVPLLPNPDLLNIRNATDQQKGYRIRNSAKVRFVREKLNAKTTIKGPTAALLDLEQLTEAHRFPKVDQVHFQCSFGGQGQVEAVAEDRSLAGVPWVDGEKPIPPTCTDRYNYAVVNWLLNVIRVAWINTEGTEVKD
jgi:hypothetical protein